MHVDDKQQERLFGKTSLSMANVRSSSSISSSIDSSMTTSTSRNMSSCSMVRQTFDSFDEFKSCYKHLFAMRWELSSVELLLALLTVLLNLLVILKIVRKPFKKKLFDRILVAHCIVDGLTGLLDVPFFHLVRLFGYWPLGRTSALLWATFDNGINSITNLHMLYMTWARLRSIRAPNTYEKELLARSPSLVCLLIWLGGLFLWTLITFSLGVDDYTTRISFKPSFVETILIFTTWFFPLAAILPISFYVIVILSRRRRKMAKIKRPPLFRTRCSNSTNSNMTTTNNTHNNNINNNTNNLFNNHHCNNHNAILIESNAAASMLDTSNRAQVADTTATTTTMAEHKTPFVSRSASLRWRHVKSWFMLGPQARFQIIIISYCVQWFPSCIIALVDPFCGCIPQELIASVYWLTFTVCLTDPLVILSLYSNTVFKSRKSTRSSRRPEI